MLSKVQAHLAQSLDVALRDTLLIRKPRRPRDPAEIEGFCRSFLAERIRPEWLSSHEPFFGPPSIADVRRTRNGALSGAGREVVDLSFRSAPELVFDEVREQIDAHRGNRFARARLFLHPDRARPAVILVHGYLGGNPAFEERFWSAGEFFRRGLHVALFVLPYHGVRKRGSLLDPPAWPSADFRVTAEGFRQAIHELRALHGILVEEGASAVGAMGMSLGGYTTALLATAEPNLAFAVPHIPLASIPDFLRDGGQIPGTASQRAELHRLLEELHAIISPLRRPVLVPPEGRMVIAGELDRITPLGHSERIASHFGVPVTTFGGGHLYQVGRGKAFKLAVSMLARQGLLPRA